MSGFEETVLSVIAEIPKGEVMTYGEVADEAGAHGAARAVGTILKTTSADIPWWRVVGSGLRIRTTAEQAELLASEGWIVKKWRLSRDAPYSNR